MNFFERRRAKKTAKEILRHAHHIRHMREDLLREADLRKLTEAEVALQQALRRNDEAALEKAGNDLYDRANELVPARRFSGIRENLEILVVAVAVAMAFRAYFVQPFKIPTGSMQPTLYGIHSLPAEKSGIMDRLPLKAVKWLVLGEWYREVRVKVPGQLTPGADGGADSPAVRYYYVGPIRYELPRDAKLNYEPGAYVEAGGLLWSGIVTAGDHVFVDKVRWNFSHPKRGCIMVFSTDGIPMLIKGTHYIKRMVGVPGDEISINPPYLIVNGKPLMDPEPVAKISMKTPPYDKDPYGHGYIPPNAPGRFFCSPAEVLGVPRQSYLGFGDNTANSFDGRYWGTVPQSNLIGPACLVYWPVSPRWGPPR